MTNRVMVYTLVAALASICSGSSGAEQKAPTQSATALATPHLGLWGFDASGMNQRINPGDDFFAYANGAWLDRTTIPSDKALVSSFSFPADPSQARIHAILVEASNGVPSQPQDDFGKIGAFYKSFLDETRVAELGKLPELRRLAVTNVHSPAPARVDVVMANIDAWYAAFNVGPERKRYIAPADRVRIW